MNKRYYALFFGTALVMGLVSCSDDDNKPVNPVQDDTPGHIELTSTQHQAIAQYNKFGFKMLSLVGCSDSYEGKNIILSPVSINYSLSMLANGATGQTRTAILTTLGYDALSIEEVNSLNKKLSNEFGCLDNRVTLNFANSVWVKPYIQLFNDFKSTLTYYYDAEVRIINDDTFISDVNTWCSGKTHGKIIDFLSSDDNSDIALFNASYFKGMWSRLYKFDSKFTREGYFNDVQGSRSSVKFMNNILKDDLGSLLYGKSENMQKCELSFGNGSFGMAFILPDEDITINQAVVNLANSDWEQLCRPYSPDPPMYSGVCVNLTLPKFKIDSSVYFNDFMDDLGLGDIFATNADFSNLSDADFSINKIIQKSTFEIDEEGAEVASVTGFLGEGAPAPPIYYEVTMKFDRPFIYVVYERSTGAFLFIGCINSFAK